MSLLLQEPCGPKLGGPGSRFYRPMRRMMVVIALATLAVWTGWFAALCWWSYHRPHVPSAALGLVHYVKTPVAVVYLGDLESMVNSAFEFTALALVILLVGGAAWFQFMAPAQGRGDTT